MPLLIDQAPVTPNLPESHTLAEAIAWAQSQLPTGQIITAVSLDGVALEGDALTQTRPQLVAGRVISLGTTSRKELSLSMLGKLYAMVQWLAPQHKEVAALLEKGEQAPAFAKLGKIFAGWQQIQNAFGGLAKLNDIVPSELPVRALTGDAILNEFCRQLAEMQTALQNRDFVLLADILQYEMDGATANWVSLLESILAVVEPQAATAA